MTHKRNIGAMRASPRCGARTKAGTQCALPAIRGKARCRLHGGATGSGAKLYNRNAWKHGVRSAKEIALKKELTAIERRMREALKDFEG